MPSTADRTFNDRAELIESAARVLTHLPRMHLISEKAPSVIGKGNPVKQHSMEAMKAEKLTDVALMAAVVRRDANAMAAIYKRYESMLRSVISSVLHEGGETDDVLHDVFIQLWNRADRFLAEKGLQGFLVTWRSVERSTVCAAVWFTGGPLID